MTVEGVDGMEGAAAGPNASGAEGWDGAEAVGFGEGDLAGAAVEGEASSAGSAVAIVESSDASGLERECDGVVVLVGQVGKEVEEPTSESVGVTLLVEKTTRNVDIEVYGSVVVVVVVKRVGPFVAMMLAMKVDRAMQALVVKGPVDVCQGGQRFGMWTRASKSDEMTGSGSVRNENIAIG